jgi:hypothetical protein
MLARLLAARSLDIASYWVQVLIAVVAVTSA